MKLRPIFTAVALVAFAGPAMAQSAFDGLYAGVEGGYSTGDFEESAGNLRLSQDAKGPSVSGFAGAGKTFDNIYLGAEANYGIGRIEIDQFDGDDKLKVDTEAYGAAARAGYVVSDNTLLFGKVGWERTNFDVKGADDKEKLDGLVLGLGAERNLGDGVAVRVGVDYTNYDKKTVGALETEDGIVPVEFGGDKVAGKVGVVFRF